MSDDQDNWAGSPFEQELEGDPPEILQEED